MENYFENGYFEKKVAETTRMIAPYVEKRSHRILFI